jgi:hypothetical protein
VSWQEACETEPPPYPRSARKLILVVFVVVPLVFFAWVALVVCSVGYEIWLAFRTIGLTGVRLCRAAAVHGGAAPDA